jgi:hypothetical protein
MSGFLADGIVRHMRALIGAIRTTTTTSKAGRCMKATGITKTTAITTTAAMIAITASTDTD